MTKKENEKEERVLSDEISRKEIRTIIRRKSKELKEAEFKNDPQFADNNN